MISFNCVLHASSSVSNHTQLEVSIASLLVICSLCNVVHKCCGSSPRFVVRGFSNLFVINFQISIFHLRTRIPSLLMYLGLHLCVIHDHCAPQLLASMP